MINYQNIINAQEMLVKYWGEEGKKVIVKTVETERKPMTFKQFLDTCPECGGDLGKMLLIGIYKLFPNVWKAIPDDISENICDKELGCLFAILILCGINF